MIRIFEEAQARNPHLRFAVGKIQENRLAEVQRSKLRRYRHRDAVMESQTLKDNDLIISSFGKHPMELRRSTDQGSRLTLTEQLQGNGGGEPVNENMQGQPAYRRWMPEKF